MCFFTVLTTSSLWSQQYNFGIGAEPKIGYLMPHRSTMAHLVEQHSYAVELSGVLQTDGTKQWHHDFNFPKISVNLFYSDLGNPNVLGEAYAFTGGIYLPFFKQNGWSLGSELQAGIGYVTKHYDVDLNPKNNAIGSHVNCLFSFGLRFEKQFLQHAMGMKVSMTHFSNGAYKLPNLGLNLPFLGLNYTYFMQPINRKDSASFEREGTELKSWNFSTQLIGSVKQIYPTGGNSYGVIALTNYAQFKATHKCMIEGGLDLIYNGSTVAYNGGGYSRDKNFQVGVYGAYVLPIHKFHMFVAMGRYLYKPLYPAGMWYHKFGGRFQIIDKLWANISIKSHWAKADYFEYGLSYRW